MKGSSSNKRPREESASADLEGNEYENNEESKEIQDLSEVCGILDQGEIYFQACLVNVDILKKTFKDLSNFLTDFQFVLSTEGTIEVFDYDAYSHDGVDLKIDQFDYFYTSLTEKKKFSFTINAKDFMECLSPIPTTSTVLMFYISEHCVDRHEQVFQISIRAINLLKDMFYDKNIRTKTSQHASLLSNINADTIGSIVTTDSSSSDDVSETVTQLSRVQCYQHHCVVEWGIKDLLQSMANSMAMSKEAKIITFTVNNGDEFIFECTAGNNLSGKARAFNRQVQICKFHKFDPPSAVCPIITNSFRVSSVLNFMKCKDLCTDVKLYFDHHLPLIMEFHLANFGMLRLFTPTYEKTHD